ncbi:hypothetical protein WISP_125552 [Willisornis vidua]|uniref:Endonuclease/exonuclease/phosphatase domain-containing protein n=1 Tax=Willisornis vidua TaxID=1566151 RepID=A0ABQ9CX09_9PASS|nr:hypothetical protein WISP_125552 [Willisornis vidua]
METNPPKVIHVNERTALLQQVEKPNQPDDKGEKCFTEDSEVLKWTEFYRGIDEEPTESLWVKIKVDITVEVCHRPPIQEDLADETLYRQIEAASHSQALVLMGDFNHPHICWRDNMAWHKLSNRFLDVLMITSFSKS